jgi:ArsR family transcriptional regulator
MTDKTLSEPGYAPVIEPALSIAQTVQLAGYLKAISDPTRLRMLDLIAQQTEPLCVCDITEFFPQNQPTISHHLKVLRDAGLITVERSGTWAYYSATARGHMMLEALGRLL